MATKAKEGPAYLVTSTDGCWHYQPVQASTPEEAIKASEPEAEEQGQLDCEYLVYEVSTPPVKIATKVALVRQ